MADRGESPVLSNRMRELLDRSKSALGTFITTIDSTAVELAGLAGFNFIVIECEHAGLSLETVGQHLRVARARDLGTLVRVPAGDWGFVQRVLDIGADGVLVPHVVDAAAADRAVSAVRYPPAGHRGMYPNAPAASFGAHGLNVRQLTAVLNRDTVLAIMIEDASAVERIEEIVRTVGVDIIVVGPSDLSASLGVIGVAKDPTLAAAIDRVLDTCRRSGVRFGMPIEHAAYPQSASDLRARGAWFLTSGSDASVLLNGFRSLVKSNS